MNQISIIIPVYNTGPYLTRCVESILHQTYSNLEIIIVDDGSKAETALLCDELAGRDKRIRLYHKKNEGVSVARNFGLTHATGDYIGFVDSDDWIDVAMYQTLLENALATGADIVYCDAQTVWDDGRREADTWPCFTSSITMRTEEIGPDALNQMAGSVWRGLFKRSVGGELRFPIGLKFSEDRYYNLQWLAASKRIRYIKEPFYFRFMRSDSCVNSYHPDATQTIRNASELINGFVSDHFGSDYLLVYEKQPLGLTLQCLSGVFASKFSFWGKYREVKKIASDAYLQQVVHKFKPSDIRLRLMGYRLYFPLYIVMWLHHKIK